MNYFFCLLFLANIFATICSNTHFISSGSETELENQRRKAFAWMSDLGYPDINNAQFVRVATGDWSQHSDGSRENSWKYGFLLREKGRSFHILTLGLEEEHYHKTPAQTPSHEEISFEVLDLSKECKALLAELTDEKNSGKWETRRINTFFRGGFSQRANLFILAWACSQQGLNRTSVKLYELAGDPRYSNYEQNSPSLLLEKIATDLAYWEMWRSILEFENLKIPRSMLHERFEKFAKRFPKSSHHARAAETAALLKKMVQEDEEHMALRKKGKPFAQLTKQEQISELIFQLRDQQDNLYPSSFLTNQNTPACKLVEIGYDAVPQLLEAIDDERFTRSVSFADYYYFSHHVLRVGDYSKAIIEKIAGFSFDEPRFAKSIHQLKDKELLKAEIKAWYAELRSKGEKRFLMDATARGDGISGATGERLVKKYRTLALVSLLKGARTSKLSEVRAKLVGLIANYDNDQSLQFLLSELRNGPLATPRLTAAEELHKLGRPEAMAAMIEWWKKSGDQEQCVKENSEDPAHSTYTILSFLAKSGSIEAINVIADDWKKRPIQTRITILETLSGRGFLWFGPPRPKKTLGVKVAIEKILVAALDDREEQAGVGGSWNGIEYSNPRVCDVTGKLLQILHPEKYKFDLGAPLSKRNHQIIVIKNTWRKANKLPPSPTLENSY